VRRMIQKAICSGFRLTSTPLRSGRIPTRGCPNVALCQSVLVTIVRGYALKLVVSTDDKNASAMLVKHGVFTFGPQAGSTPAGTAKP
jgi:hypothetical protein